MSEPGRNYLRFADGAFLTLEPTTGRYALEKKDGTFISSFDVSGNLRINGNILQTAAGTLAGAGVPQIVSAPAISLGNTGPVTNFINFTPPATAGTYRMAVLINVTAWTTPAGSKAVIGYKDENGAAASDNLLFNNNLGTGGSTTNIASVNRFYGIPQLFSIDNSATAITLSTIVFTGSPVYDIKAILEFLGSG
jgi:hypothetical protein